MGYPPLVLTSHDGLYSPMESARELSYTFPDFEGNEKGSAFEVLARVTRAALEARYPVEAALCLGRLLTDTMGWAPEAVLLLRAASPNTRHWQGMEADRFRRTAAGGRNANVHPAPEASPRPRGDEKVRIRDTAGRARELTGQGDAITCNQYGIYSYH